MIVYHFSSSYELSLGVWSGAFYWTYVGMILMHRDRPLKKIEILTINSNNVIEVDGLRYRWWLIN